MFVDDRWPLSKIKALCGTYESGRYKLSMKDYSAAAWHFRMLADELLDALSQIEQLREKASDQLGDPKAPDSQARTKDPVKVLLAALEPDAVMSELSMAISGKHGWVRGGPDTPKAQCGGEQFCQTCILERRLLEGGVLSPSRRLFK